MSLPSSPALTIDVQSRHFESRVALLALTAGGVAPFLVTVFDAVLSVVVGLAAILVLACGLWRAGWLAGRARRLRTVCWLSDGRWLLIDGANRVFEGRLAAGSRVFAHCVWLQWNLDAGRRSRSLLLAAGDGSDNELRRLIVRLRVEGAGPRGSTAGVAAL